MRPDREKLDVMLRSIAPQSVERFLIKNGYHRADEAAGELRIYANNRGDAILVPFDPKSSDYTRRLESVVDLFVSPTSPFDDVIGRVVLPDCDIVRYRIQTPEAAWGQLRLSYSYQATHALFDVLKFSAGGVSSRLLDYTNVSRQAQAYADACHFGQTEFGSFVLKIFCPTDPLQTKDQLGEPFGRASTKAAIENLEFTASERSEDPTQPLPPTLNRQVASAITRLKPESTFNATEVTINFAPIDDVGDQALHATPLEPQILDLGPFIYSRARSIRDRLKKAEAFGRELLRGYITDLHKDRPTLSEQSRQISVDVKYGSSFRKVTLRLLPAEYRRALAWHDDSREVQIDAIFDKRGRPWSVANLFDFSPVPNSSSQAELFDPPTPS